MKNSTTHFEALFTSSSYQAFLPPQMYCRGFIFAVATSPDIPMPEKWMPWLVTDNGSQTPSVSFDNMAEGLMDGLRRALLAMRNEHRLLPRACVWHDDPTQRELLTEWLSGLLNAHSRLEPVWQQAWKLAQSNPENDQGVTKQEDPAKRLSRCLKLFSTLASPELALQKRSPEQAAVLKQHFTQLADQLPAMLNEYVDLAGELAGVLPNQFETFVQNQTDAE